MKPTLNEKFLAYLALFSGITLSIVAEYYSILGLTAIFSAAVIPVIIMGIALGVGKVTATLWLKQNWDIAPWSIRTYLLSAIAVLMLITSMGIFGFLSKAHSDQSLVSGDVQSKIAIYDEKIKTAKENIEANRKQLKQMDEAVDQIMGRSSDEKGADKANAVRKSQQRDRSALAKDIEANQRLIASLNDEAAPIRAEVRKVEAEVGPIKYIAAFVYGEANEALLEKAVTWVIIILIVVFDPLAVILLLSSQISFQNFREREQELVEGNSPGGTTEVVDSEPPTVTEQQETIEDTVVSTSTATTSILAQHPYLLEPFVHFKDLAPMVYKPEPVEETVAEIPDVERPEDYIIPPEPEIVPAPVAELINSVDIDWDNIPPTQEYIFINGQNMSIRAAKDLYGPKHLISSSYVQNEEQNESGRWNKVITEQEYRSKAEQNLKNESSNNTNNAA
jgi:hypothetical protein